MGRGQDGSAVNTPNLIAQVQADPNLSAGRKDALSGQFAANDAVLDAWPGTNGGLISMVAQLAGFTPFMRAARLTGRTDEVVNSIETPHGLAYQADTSEARGALANAQGGATLYRTGQFGVQNTTDAQFWSFQNPATTSGYVDSMGMPGSGAESMDWIMGGKVFPESPIVTRPAPGLGVNSGGSMEAVVPPGGVQAQWFHMP